MNSAGTKISVLLILFLLLINSLYAEDNKSTAQKKEFRKKLEQLYQEKVNLKKSFRALFQQLKKGEKKLMTPVIPVSSHKKEIEIQPQLSEVPLKQNKKAEQRKRKNYQTVQNEKPAALQKITTIQSQSVQKQCTPAEQAKQTEQINQPPVTSPAVRISEPYNLNIPDTEYVEPEIKNYVHISKVDMNRFYCEKGKIVGVFYSKDKGIIGRKAGANFFLRIIPNSFAFEHPFELFLMCGDDKTGYLNTYEMIVTGERISARTIILKKGVSENIKEQMQFFSGNTRTQNIVRLVKASYTEDFPEEFSIYRVFKIINPISFGHSPDEMKIILYKTVDTGMWIVNIYFVEALKNITLHNEDFVKENTIAVAVFNPYLEKGQFGKVMVIQDKLNKF